MRGRGHRLPPRPGLHLLTEPRERLLRQLGRDGFERLGEVSLGTTLVVGDPAELLAPPGAGRWHGAAVRPGTWHVLGRPTEDGEDLAEVVLTHEDALATFWDLYDEAGEAAAVLLPTRRVLAVDGASRTDAELLRSAAEPEELPWLLDRGVVLAGLQQHPAHVWQSGAPEARLVAIALERAPTQRVSTDPHQVSGSERDED